MISVKPIAKAECCGTESFDPDKQLCCGPNKRILERRSIKHQCCASDQFDPETKCCCPMNGTLHVVPYQPNCCAEESDEANITQGIRQKVSSYCELKPYDRLNEICCQGTISVKPVAKAECCGTESFDPDKQLCCGPNKRILERRSIKHQCCASDQFDPETKCCCPMNGTLHVVPYQPNCCAEESDEANITQGISQEVSSYCELKPYDRLNEICCQGTISVKPVAKAECCGTESFDPDKQLCCGPNKRILERRSIKHQCCASDQFDPETKCCCPMNGTLHVLPYQPDCCAEESDEDWSVAAAKVYDPHTDICCDGVLSERKPWMDKVMSPLG
ncbi:galaxin [Thalassophryne amazonica]|uniref:galaxin n=1 Tax=Thalassophryne amazonica TaxID=390379 RepID=UPI00147133DD|nr:galaxin [Thalassophryne amazonica]